MQQILKQRLDLVKKRFKGLKGEGTDLWEVWNLRENEYNGERICDKWLKTQAEAYMEEDCDDEWKEHVDLSHCDHCGRGKKLSIDGHDARWSWAYERANNDLECFYPDHKRGSEEALRECFGDLPDFEIEEVEKIIYDDDGEEVEQKWLSLKNWEQEEIINAI